jgi:hypothetical protein
MRLQLGIWSTSITFALAAGLCAASACSLGEATIPQCDAQAAPGTPTACQKVAACDDGTGYPTANDACCSAFAAETYTGLAGVTLDEPTCIHAVCTALDAGAPPTGCPAIQTDLGACSEAIKDYRLCIEGRLGPHEAGTGGSGNAPTDRQGGTPAAAGAGGA